jgi:hypothetical protein
MKKVICLLLCVLIFVAGCAGHEPNPIAAYIPGDENKSCKMLKAEIAQIQTEISTKQQEKSTKDFWNVAEFVGGFFLIIPWFFMDVKGAEKVEAQALKTRAKRLTLIAAEKGCDLTATEVIVK